MKKILFIVCFCTPFIAFAASKTDSIINIDKLPQHGILLDRGWKFHAGDNQSWAAVGYDDSNWNSINPSQSIFYLPQLRKAQIGWFRLTLLVGEALRGKTVAFAINQMGASEIYLNGELIRQYGKVSNNDRKEKIYDPRGQPLTIQLGDKPEQILAIRYSYTRQNLYFGYGYHALDVLISEPAGAWNNFNDYINNLTDRALVFGVFIILSILHLFIYLSYRDRKINLYLSVYTFVQACAFINAFLGTSYSSNSESYFSAIFLISAPLSQIFLLLIVYEFFNQPKKLWFKLLALTCVLIIPLGFWRDFGNRNLILDPFGIIIYIEIIRISIIAFRKKQQGATVFLIGQSVGLFFFLSFVYIYDQPEILRSIEVDFAFLAPAIIISILLAREFAQNNISLKQQLEEVKKLSEKNLAQELEKQQILASQNELLEKQVEKRTTELSQSLTNLKQTQAQLVQSEKMASLGELTAGIAHEIQNPLNFVNNFSDVNTELIDEMQAERKKETRDFENEDDILTIIKENEQKINLHGKRADAIVKGMLQHSKSGSGLKEPTNINNLADEFMRLAYHGLRAKDKSFNAELTTNFDKNLPEINVVQQDIGRVLLNLFNNAFYALIQKQRIAGDAYKPEVSVTTHAEIDHITITVKDNGTGIPDAIKDKIMQPFFTTKPPGEGTGLGLSLTYDMIVMGHGGSITVNSTEGKSSEFIITLPRI